MSTPRASQLLQRTLWCEIRAEFRPEGLFLDDYPAVLYWERSLQEALAREALGKRGTILEIGYGLGMASRIVRGASPELHLIVEAHPQVATKAVQESARDTRTKVLYSPWESTTRLIRSSSISGIIFDPSPLGPFSGSVEETLAHLEPFLGEAARLLEPEGRLVFADFSEGVLNSNRFVALTPSFSNARSHTVDLAIPDGCSYASGTSAHCIVLVR